MEREKEEEGVFCSFFELGKKEEEWRRSRLTVFEKRAASLLALESVLLPRLLFHSLHPLSARWATSLLVAPERGERKSERDERGKVDSFDAAAPLFECFFSVFFDEAFIFYLKKRTGRESSLSSSTRDRKSKRK